MQTADLISMFLHLDFSRQTIPKSQQGFEAKTPSMLPLYIYIYINGIARGDLSLIPGRCCFHFTKL